MTQSETDRKTEIQWQADMQRRRLKQNATTQKVTKRPVVQMSHHCDKRHSCSQGNKGEEAESEASVLTS